MSDITPIDPTKTALIILDLQNDVIIEGGAFADSGAPKHATTQKVVDNVKRLAEAVRAKGGQVIHVHHHNSTGAGHDRDSKQNAGLYRAVREVNALVPGTWGAQPVDGLEPQEDDIVIVKQRMGGFSSTPLDIKLRGLDAERIIVTGAWTNMSVEMTSRQGADLGYEVVVVSDGTSTVDEEWQKAALDYALTNLAEIGTTDDVIAAIS
jgi:nicotinamidase-related amidase